MSKELQKTIQLTDREIKKYIDWVEKLQQSHASGAGAPLDGLSITFEITNIGTTVVAHAGCFSYPEPQLVLRG